MRKIIFVLIMLCCIQAVAQQKQEESSLTKEQLIGSWQKGSKVVGSGLNQHFIFNKDGTFVLNLDSDGDDARNLITIKGKYRMVKNELYLTVLSKTYIDGELEMGGVGVTFSLLQFGVNSRIKEIKEPNPKEMLDPCYITVITRTNIKLNNQTYYKVK